MLAHVSGCISEAGTEYAGAGNASDGLALYLLLKVMPEGVGIDDAADTLVVETCCKRREFDTTSELIILRATTESDVGVEPCADTGRLEQPIRVD